MSSYTVLSKSNDDDFEITGEIRLVHPLSGCRDKVRATLVGSGKPAAGPKYKDTKAYLGFYKGEVVEAYFGNVGSGFQVHCGANWAGIDKRLDLDKTLKRLSQSALEKTIRERIVEDAPLGGRPRAYAESPESLETSPGAGMGAGAQEGSVGGGVEAWREDIGSGVQGVWDGAQRWEDHNMGNTAPFLQIFPMRIADIAAIVFVLVYAWCTFL
jgi:hypothetical protein